MANMNDICEMKARIIVFRVGGAGGNAVNNMIAAGLQRFLRYLIATGRSGEYAMKRLAS